MHGEFREFMADLGLPAHEYDRGVAVGVSGGADSMALALLMHAWCVERDLPMLSLVCDHGLRPQSLSEARLTLERLDARGIDARLIRLHMTPGSAVQERARNARYSAMSSCMRREGIGLLAVAHHAMDQAETVAHRLEEGTCTLLGRAGILPVRVMGDALLLRPLLQSGKGSLKDFLREERVGWVEDPSNANPAFTRTRTRAALSSEPAQVEALLEVAHEGLELHRCIEAEKADILSRALISSHAWGASCIDMSALPSTLAGAEVLRELLHRASGTRPAIPASRLLDAMHTCFTLGGAEVRSGKGGTWIFRELSRMQESRSSACAFAGWDERIRLGADGVHGGEIEALGTDVATSLRRSDKSGPGFLAHLPHKVLAGVPCIRDKNGRGLSVPHLGMGMEVATLPTLRTLPTLASKPSFAPAIS